MYVPTRKHTAPLQHLLLQSLWNDWLQYDLPLLNPRVLAWLQ